MPSNNKEISPVNLKLKRELHGSILDIGGGGEGIISRLYGADVISIDIRRDELDEAPANCSKIVMDAAKLAFENESLDNVAFFYSLMFMKKETQKQAIAEACRVLIPGGKLVIWDGTIESAFPQPFLIELLIDIEGLTITPTYGILKTDGAQDSGMFVSLCENCGLTLNDIENDIASFRLLFTKEPDK